MVPGAGGIQYGASCQVCFGTICCADAHQQRGGGTVGATGFVDPIAGDGHHPGTGADPVTQDLSQWGQIVVDEFLAGRQSLRVGRDPGSRFQEAAGGVINVVLPRGK